jgi:predicted RNA binding protein YcfA (HicA-like mRNA interferase family)
MTRLPRLKGKEIIRILEKAGFRKIRTKGSHTFMKHVDGRDSRASSFRGNDRARTLRAILRDVEMSVDDLLK